MNTVLLVGSSIFEVWENTENLLPGYRVINRAVGGTITSYWVEHLSEVLMDETPDAVLFYCGSNDINDGIPEKVILKNFSQCRNIVHSYSSDALFAYFSIIKAPQKNGKWEWIDRLNTMIQNQLQAKDLYVGDKSSFLQRGTTCRTVFSR